MQVCEKTKRNRSVSSFTRRMLDRAINGVMSSVARRPSHTPQLRPADMPMQSVDNLEPRILFTTDIDFALYNPAGTRVYLASQIDTIAASGEVDEYRVTLAGGQKLSAVVQPIAGSTLQPRITIVSDDGTVTYVDHTSPADGVSVVAQPIALPSGSYLIRVTDDGTSDGSYKLSAYLNTSFEDEPEGANNNDTTATATNLNAQTIILQASGRLANVHGFTDGLGNSDLYRMDLNAGDALSALIRNPTEGFGQFKFETIDSVLPVINTMGSGDFNNDGIPDIVVGGEGNFFQTKLQVLISNGIGGYSSINDWGDVGTISDLVVADFDDDGKMDVATINNGSSNLYDPNGNGSRLTIFHGNGSGDVLYSVDSFQNDPCYTLTTGNFNDDNLPDLVLGGFPELGETGKIQILLNNGGGFDSPIEYATQGRVYDIQAKDLNNDGIDEIITAEGDHNETQGWVGRYFLNTNDPNILERTAYEGRENTVIRVAVGDVNNDTYPDIVDTELETGRGTTSVTWLNQDGDVILGYGIDLQNNEFSYRSTLTLADINRDGYLDVLSSSGDFSFDRVTLNLNGRDGFFFGGGSDFNNPAEIGAFVVADVNLDGDLDLIAGSTQRSNGGGDDYSEIATRLGRGEQRIQLLDSSGNTILFSNSGGFIADQGILDFISSTGGTYYVSVTGDLGAEYQLGVTGGAKIGVDPQLVDNRTQDITAAKQVIGNIESTGSVDSYTINIASGDTITATIFARNYGPGDPNNDLAPRIVLKDSLNNIVASDLNAADLPSAAFNYTATLSGTYTVEVTSNSGSGDYDLLVTGSNAPVPPFGVSSTFPADGSVVDFRPYVFVDFTQPIFLPSVQASDLTVNGIPALSFGSFDGDTLYFQTDSLFTNDGVYTVNIANGAITSSLGAPMTAKTWSFTVDQNGPRVLSSTISTNQTFAPGPLTWNVSFSEPIRRIIDSPFFIQIVLDNNDIATTNLTTGQNIPISQMVRVTPPPNVDGDPTELNFVYNNLQEGLYEGRLLSSPSAFGSDYAGDQFSANPLDGEFSGTFPSGDGNKGGDFVVNFVVDAPGITPLNSLTSLSPLGSLVHETSTVRALHATGDIDSFSLNLDPNQQVTVTLVPSAGTSATAKLELKDPNGNSLGTATGAPGDPVILQSINGTVGGTYQIDASSLSGTAGYTLRVVINAAAENEAFGAGNNTRASAQSLTMRTLAAGAAGVRGAVLGTADAGSDDYYKLDLVAGQPASFAISGIEGGSVAMRLEDPSGNFITNGASGQFNADKTIIDYVPSISGTFYVAVSGTGRYNLLATRAASFEREPITNNSSATQDLSISKQALGNLKGGAKINGQIDVLQLGPDTISFGDGNRLIDQLNNDSYFNFNAVRGTASSGDTLAELLPYDVVLLTSGANVISNPGIATALKQYIELGGAVVVIGFGSSLLGNTSMTTLRSSMPVDFLGGIQAIAPNFNPLGTHPITNLVPATTFPISQYRAFGTLFPNATTIGTDSSGSPTLIVRDNLGFGGRSAFLGLEFADTTNTDPNVRGGTGDRLLEQTLAWVAESGDQADTYTISANSGDNIVLTTSIPMGETALPINLLDPIIDLYSPAGILVASNDNALDGRNARINYLVPNGQAGAYKAVVRGASIDGGAYTIQVTGVTGSVLLAGPSVLATTPTAGQTFATPPTTIDVTLTEPIQSNSVQTSDLVLSSGTVTNAQLIEGNIVRFTINVADVDTTYTYTIPAGAFTDLQGDVSNTYSSSFVVDKRGPRVVSSNPSTQASSPFSSWTFTFNEPIAITWNNYTDIIDSFTGPGGTNLLAAFVLNNIVASGNNLTISFSPRTAAGNYTLTLKPDRIKDLVGNKMDQDQDGVNGEVVQDKYSSTITLASPNLLVDNVQVLTPAVYGSPVTVQWTVRNNGTDPAADGWSDRLYLSADNIVDGNDLILLTIGSPTVPLAPGQTYTRTQSINLPLNTTITPGTYRFIVRTDRSFNQAESIETDNDTASAATTVSLPALPDLAVSNVQLTSPANPVSGGQATIQWTLTNTGTAAISGVIRDRISISADDQPGSDVDLTEVDYAVNLAPGQSVVRSLPVNIPVNQFGTKWIIVKTDSNNTVFEYTNEPNNTGVSSPVSISLSPIPDLVVTSITTPANVTSGTTQTITWTLANQGSGDWNGTISENIFLSDDSSIGTDTYYKTVTFTGSIPAGQSITRSTTVDLAIQTNGPKWAIVQTDSANNVFENTGESNNTTIDDNPMTVVLPPTPDLIVTSITAPTSSLSGRSLPVSWTIKNDGTATMSGTFASNVFLSADDTIGNDQGFDTFTFTGTIAPGQSITQSQNIQLPNVYSGNYKVVVITDAGNSVFENTHEDNNALIDDTTLAVTQSPYPNLQVTSTTVPPTAQSQENVALSWIVTNNGDASTDASEWYDSVYISANPTFDATDVQLATVRNASYLNAGESYQQNVSVTIPQGVQGTYYFIVKSDINNQVFEYQPSINAEGDNQTTSSASVITLSPPPDLMVTSIGRPITAFSGELSTVSWTITNNGTGATRANETTWYDQVWISNTTSINGNSTLLGTFPHVGGLAVGGSYNNSQSVRLPVGISGDYHFIISTDSTSAVYEDAFESNNDVAAATTNVLLSPPPDLHITSITGPVTATAGRTISVDFTVANEGSQTTPNNSWVDNLYLSPTPILDNSTAIFITQRGRSGALTPGQSYTATISGAVPLNLTGTYYVFVVADANNQVFELDNANNVVGSINPVTISQAFADLQITNFSPPANAEAGTLAPFSLTITNAGTGDSITNSWNDKVVLSSDNVYGNGDDVYIINQTHNGVLGAGASYTINSAFPIPAYVQAGTYNLFYETDWTNTVTESNDTNNNNSFAPVSIAITRQTPDLQVIDTTAPLSAQSGQSVAVSFTVKNLGTAATVASAWIDQLFLSTDTVIDNEDKVVRELQHTNILAIGGQYTVNTNITIPVDFSGNYYLIARTDRDNSVVEGALDLNNDRPSAAPIAIGLQTLPDLAVSNVTAPATANSGQQTTLTYTIQNIGTDITSNFWFDTVYLSQDTTLDRADKALGTYTHSSPMAGGTQYVETQSVKLPSGLSGQYYLIVSTDNSDRIYERGLELNNVNRSAVMQINLLPPADLVAGAIVLPVNGSPGQNATITYTVNNNSAQPAIGKWTDSLYISKDQNWDINDSLFTRVDHDGDVAANSSYSHTVTAPLPGVTPGNYYLIVRSDILNQVPESIESNNLSASLDTVILDVPALVLDTPSNGTLSQNKSAYYRVTVPEGETLFIDLDSATATGSTQLFVKYAGVPTRADFDFGYKDALSADQKITIPKTKAGTYYILAYGDSLSAPTNYSIEARLLNFEITDTTYGVGGNGGKLTLQINGAKFDRTIIPTLVSPGGGERAAERVFFTDKTRLYATFDLTGLTPNAYDVKLTKTGGPTAIVNDALQVIAGTSGQAKPTIFSPTFTFAHALFQFTTAWGNDGINDVPAPYLVVTSDRLIGQHPDFIDVKSYTFLGTGQDDGPGGILRPDQVVHRVFYAKNGPKGSGITLFADRLGSDPSKPYDWESLREQSKQPEFSDEQFAPAFAKMIANIGPTWGDYLRALSEGASMIQYVNSHDQLDNTLLPYHLHKAAAELNTSISGRISAPEIDVSIYDQIVTAHNKTTNEYFSTRSYVDGSYIFSIVTPGEYEIFTDAGITQSGNTVTVASNQHVTNKVINVIKGSSLSGFVHNADGSNSDNAEITVYNNDSGYSRSVTAESDGTYVVDALQPGTYTIFVDAPGQARGIVENIAVGTQVELIQNFNLSVQAKVQGSLSFGIGSNTPIDISLIKLPAPSGFANSYTATLNGNSFEIKGLPAGQYLLTIARNGYASVEQTVNLAAGQTLNLSTINLATSAVISGQISTTASNFSVGNNIVGLWQGNTLVRAIQSDRFGAYVFNDVPAGTYTVKITEAANYYTDTPTITISSGQTISSTNIVVHSGGKVTGTVTRQVTNTPMAGVEVTLVQSDGKVYYAITNNVGVYTFAGLNLGTYTVKALDASASATVTSLDATPAASANLAVQVGSIISGTLLDSSGNPSVGSVNLMRNGTYLGSYFADNNGHYQILVNEPGTYDLVGQSIYASYSPVTGIVVTIGTDISQNLSSGTGSVHITLPVGSHTTAVVQLEHVTSVGIIDAGYSGNPLSDTVDFSNLVPGTYRLRVIAANNLGAFQTISVGTIVTNVNVTLNTEAKLSGVVTSGGTPVGGIKLSLVDSTNNRTTITASTSDGSYTIQNLLGGTYNLVVSGDGYETIIQTGLVFVAGATATQPILLTTSTARVTGRIIDASGNPVVNAHILIMNSDETIQLGSEFVGADGTFNYTGASGANLHVYYAAVGSEPGVVNNVDINPGATTALGDLVLTPVVYQSNAPETSIIPRPRNNDLSDLLNQTRNTSLATQKPVTGNNPKGTITSFFTFPGWGTFVENQLDSWGRIGGESYTQDLYPLDKCGKCIETLRDAVQKIKIQELNFSAGSGYVQTMRKNLKLATVAFAKDAIAIAGTIATVVLALKAIAAAVATAALGEAGVAAATGSVKFILANPGARYAIGYAVSTITGAILNLGNVIQNASQRSTPQEASDSLLESGNILTSVDQLMQNLLVVISEAWRESAPKFGAVSGIADLISVAYGAKGLIDTINMKDMHDILNEVVSMNDQLDQVKLNYRKNVVAAAKAAAKHKACYFAAKDDCEGSVDIPDDILDTLRFIGALNSLDPNDITGPTGYGPEHYVKSTSTLDYTIRFENSALATAPAHRVVITQNLDSDLDVRTFRLGDFGFGGSFFDVPENSAFYQTRLDIRDSNGIYLDVVAGVDIVNRQAFWQFISIDPATGDEPTSPLLGFLPPNLTSPEGEGFVQYTVLPTAGLTTGTVIDALATIVFDQEAPLDTPAIFNTLDAVAPSSNVTALPPINANGENITVNWEGLDETNGSAIATFDVYVSVDNAPFTLWIDNTDLRQAIYTGQQGHTYSFYSVSVDNTGNLESAPAIADATTSIASSNHAPDLDVGAVTGTIDEGSAFSRNGLASDVDVGDVIGATVDYDDGVGFIPLTLAVDGSFSLSHTYTDNGLRKITIRVTDTSNVTTEKTIDVTVNNVNPTIAAISDVVIPFDGTGGDLNLGGSFLDPGADTFTGQVDYGSGFVPLTLLPVGTFALNFRYTTPGLYAVTVKVTDDDTGEGTRTFNVRLLPPRPTVSNLIVNDGNIQRSMIKTLTLTFDQGVTVPVGAISLNLRTPTGPVPVAATLAIAPYGIDGKTWVISFTGTGLEGGSLADGVYDLAVNGTLITDAFGQTMASSPSFNFHRLFGDSDGDRDADAVDQTRIRAVLNKPASYTWYFDNDNDGDVDNNDFVAARLRFNKVLFS